jgi:uncharacterized membrane protein
MLFPCGRKPQMDTDNTGMKYLDIERIQKAGLITPEQQRRIVEHFKLKEEGSRFLTIISFVGAILVACGIILLISANWEQIPRGIKIGVGLLLMLGAHGGGWYLREVNGQHRKTGEALHLVGSGLFLGNIALIGQIYHLSARPPNAILLWWAGIAALPWLLRSKAQHILALLAFGLWFGMEINEQGSLIYFGGDEYQLLLYALLGLVYLGGGYCLRRTSFAEFASPTEKLGLLALTAASYPLTWGVFDRNQAALAAVSPWIFPALAALAVVAVALGVSTLPDLSREWRLTWGLALAGTVALLAGALYVAPHWSVSHDRHAAGYHWVCSGVLFLFCLLQIQVGVQRRSEFMLNLGVAFIALIIIAAYISLFGSMARTGLVFLGGGVFLILFGIYLEKKRRTLMRQMKESAL